MRTLEAQPQENNFEWPEAIHQVDALVGDQAGLGQSGCDSRCRLARLRHKRAHVRECARGHQSGCRPTSVARPTTSSPRKSGLHKVAGRESVDGSRSLGKKPAFMVMTMYLFSQTHQQFFRDEFEPGQGSGNHSKWDWPGALRYKLEFCRALRRPSACPLPAPARSRPCCLLPPWSSAPPAAARPPAPHCGTLSV